MDKEAQHKIALKSILLLKEATNLVSKAYQDIVFINKGNSNIGIEPVQFDYCTSPPLSAQVDELNTVIKKVTDIVYQNKEAK